ncbi:MAG: hypothetical protein ACRDTE_33385 [Pseudonocardiaceae bacterium]
MLQGVEVHDGWAVLDPADVGLAQAYPLAKQGLGNAAGAVDRVVVTVGAVGPGHLADVLGGEGISELVGVPELRGYVRRGDELVAGGPFTPGALASGVVVGQLCAAAAVTVSGWS